MSVGVKCFGILCVDDEDILEQDLPVFIGLSENHINVIKKAVEFVKQTPSITRISVDLCLGGLPNPEFKILDENLSRQNEDRYSYMYARIFQGSIGLGVLYEIMSYNGEPDSYANYFAYIDTDDFMKQAEEGLIVLGGDDDRLID